MLVLSRKVNEGILLKVRTKDGTEEEVLVRVIDVIGGRKVRLGIDAPKDVTILRDELVKNGAAEKYKKKQAEKESKAVDEGPPASYPDNVEATPV